MNQNSMSSVEEVGNWSVHIGLNLVTHIILKMKQMNKRYCLVHTITGYSYGSWESYGCEVIVINGTDVSDTEDLVADMMSLLASVYGKFYGK